MFDLMQRGTPARYPVPLEAAPAPTAAGDDSADRGPDWRRAAAAVGRHKWAVLLFTILGGVGGWFAAQLMPPKYEARAAIWIDESDRRNDPQRPLGPGDLFDAQGWVQLMKSNAVLDSVVAQLHLFARRANGGNPAVLDGMAALPNLRPGRYTLALDTAAGRYTLADAEKHVLESVTPGDSIGHSIGIAWQPPAGLKLPAAGYLFTLRRPHAVSEGLADALDISINPQASLLIVTLSGTNPEQTAATLNAIALQYVQVATTLQHQRLTELTNILTQQVAAASGSLNEAERELEDFRVRTITLPRDRPTGSSPGSGPAASDMAPADPVIARFTQTQDQLAATRADLATVERLVAATADTGASLSEFEGLAVVAQSPPLVSAFKTLDDKQAQLRTMRQRYTDAYAPVSLLQADVTQLRQQTIPRLARELRADLMRRAGALGDEVAGIADSLRAIPPRATEEARLMRNVAMATTLYNTLQQHYDETRIARSTNVSDVRILDRAAVPPAPTKNTALRTIFVALVGALGLSMVGAVLRDRMDPRFRYPEQVSREMGVAILGSVPYVRPSADGAVSNPAFHDAVRGVRMNVSYAYGATTPLALTVTSPGSVDGKSFVSLHLARAFAEMGRRTVLVDGDVRRGTQHRRLRVPRKPGLIDYLHGDVTLDDVIKPTSIAECSLVPSGTRAAEGPELLASPRMQRLMAELRTRFDVIICDSPPLTAGIDPFVLGAATGSMVLVIRPGVSMRDVTQIKLEVLNRMPVRLLGAVLNAVPAAAPYHYYSHYLPGYETANETLGGATAAQLPAGGR